MNVKKFEKIINDFGCIMYEIRKQHVVLKLPFFMYREFLICMPKESKIYSGDFGNVRVKPHKHKSVILEIVDETTI